MSPKRERPSAWDQAGRLLAVQPLTEMQLRRKLFQRKYLAEEIEEVMIRARELGWVDDMKTAEAWVEQWIRNGGHGRLWASAKLAGYGIPRAAVESLLNSRWTDEIETSLARRVLGKELAKHPGELLTFGTGEKLKIMASMARKGFDHDIIRQVMDES